MIPNAFKTTRMTTITSRVWTALPERGKLENIFGPKYPTNHRTSRITIIKLSMKFLLLNDLSMVHHTVNAPGAHPAAGEY